MFLVRFVVLMESLFGMAVAFQGIPSYRLPRAKLELFPPRTLRLSDHGDFA